MIDTLSARVRALLEQNRREQDGFQYTVPSPDSYPYQWLWDSCFHAIILSHFDVDAAKREIRSLLSRRLENGMVPHIIYWKPVRTELTRRLDIAWGRDGTSSITQPPMIAYAIWRIFERDQDAAFLEETYSALFHFYQYLLHDRDPHARHLIGIINPDESGEDNSPRFDSVLGLTPKHEFDTNYERRLALVRENKECNFDAPFCMKNFFWVKDVPFNAIMVENLRALARIAGKIDRAYDASYFESEAGHIAESMRALMLEDGIMWSTYGEQYTKIKVKTWAMFAPLFAQIPTQEEAETLVRRHLENEREFRTPYSMPTVSLDDPSFDAEGFWRGPTWIAANWFVCRGLRRYGLMREADKLRDSSLALIEKSGFREYYNPHTGEGLGAQDFTWGGLVLDMHE